MEKWDAGVTHTLTPSIFGGRNPYPLLDSLMMGIIPASPSSVTVRVAYPSSRGHQSFFHGRAHHNGFLMRRADFREIMCIPLLAQTFIVINLQLSSEGKYYRPAVNLKTGYYKNFYIRIV